MPNQRGKNQTCIAFPLDGELLRLVDEARGVENRSAFIRSAIVTELGRRGIGVDPLLAYPPDRTKVVRYGQTEPQGVEMNDRRSSEVPAAASSGADGVSAAEVEAVKNAVVFGKGPKRKG